MDERNRKDDDIIIDLIRATAEQKAVMDYIKTSLDEIKQEIKALKADDKCKDCEVKRTLDAHLANHADNKKMKITVALSLIGSGIALAGMILKIVGVV